MIYNGDSDGQDLFSFCDDLINTDDNQFPLAAKARAFNKAGKDIWTWIFDAYGGWQYDDSNQTDLPYATNTLTADQTTYALPSGTLGVRGIEVKNTGGTWLRLIPITEEQIRERSAVGEFYKTSATPQFYSIVGDTVKLFPAANWTQASSFKVFFDRGSVVIASTATSTSPGFASEFHEAQATGAALVRAKAKGLPQIATLREDWADYEKRIKSFYSRRFEQLFPHRVKAPDYTKENV